MIKQCSNLISQNDLMVFRFDDLLVPLFFTNKFEELSSSALEFVCLFFILNIQLSTVRQQSQVLFKQKCVVFISIGYFITLNIRKRTQWCTHLKQKFSPQKPVRNKVRNHLHTLFILILTYSFDSGRTDTHTCSMFMPLYVYSLECRVFD